MSVQNFDRNIVLSLKTNNHEIGAILYSLEHKTIMQVLTFNTSETDSQPMWTLLRKMCEFCDVISGNQSDFECFQTQIPVLWTKKWMNPTNEIPVPVFIRDELKSSIETQTTKNPYYVLICDTETTDSYITSKYSYDTIEIACLLFDLSHRKVVCEVSTLIPTTKENKAFQWNNINTTCANRLPKQQVSAAFDAIIQCVSCSNVLMAHWAEMDRWSIGKIADLADAFINANWVCSCSQLGWKKYKVRKMFRGRPTNPKLQDLCTDYGVSYENAHRAIGDCRLLLQCFVQRDDLATFTLFTQF